MKTVTLLLCIFLMANTGSIAQTDKRFTETDRKYLLAELARSRDAILRECEALTASQWRFSPDSGKWNIGQVLEHLGLYERIFAQEADIMLSSPPEPALDSLSKPDSVYLRWMEDPSPHRHEWNAEPLGLMKGTDNIRFFRFGRDHLLDFIRSTTYDLKSHFTFRWGEEKRRSIYALMVVHFGHTDRHLKQILRIKQHVAFPKK